MSVAVNAAASASPGPSLQNAGASASSRSKVPTWVKVSIGLGVAGILGIVVLIAGFAFAAAQLSPIETSWRQSAIDPAGLVLQVRNPGSRHLSCHLSAFNKMKGQSTEYSFALGPNQQTEIGLLEAGWSFKSRERVTISTEGFWDRSLSVP